MTESENEQPVDPETARKFFAGSCDFFWGASSADNLPPITLPEIAFVGRSNVGKSSLINALTGREALARVSNTPGRTREINFFRLNDRLILADLPGYGYAKASKALAAEWQKLIFAYLRGRASLRRVALLIDARRGVGDVDREVMGLLDKAAVSYLLVLTKLDQLSAGEAAQVLETTLATSRKHVAAYPGVEATSALKGQGLEGLRAHLVALAAP
jgi:GTP-binding protein